MAKRATVVALVCGVVGGVIAGYFTGSAQLAVIWALICMPPRTGGLFIYH